MAYNLPLTKAESRLSVSTYYLEIKEAMFTYVTHVISNGSCKQGNANCLFDWLVVWLSDSSLRHTRASISISNSREQWNKKYHLFTEPTLSLCYQILRLYPSVCLPGNITHITGYRNMYNTVLLNGNTCKYLLKYMIQIFSIRGPLYWE